MPRRSTGDPLPAPVASDSKRTTTQAGRAGGGRRTCQGGAELDKAYPLTVCPTQHALPPAAGSGSRCPGPPPRRPGRRHRRPRQAPRHGRPEAAAATAPETCSPAGAPPPAWLPPEPPEPPRQPWLAPSPGRQTTGACRRWRPRRQQRLLQAAAPAPARRGRTEQAGRAGVRSEAGAWRRCTHVDRLRDATRSVFAKAPPQQSQTPPTPTGLLQMRW